MESFRWGIAGPGRIAHKFAKSLPFSTGVLEGVASSEKVRAVQFAQEYKVPFSFGSYYEMIHSGTIDAIYIATTNQKHVEIAQMALEAGLPVLCEKPMAMSLSETMGLIETAKLHHTFLMEGLWSLYLPHIRKAKEWIAEGRIGKVVHVYADFGFKANPDPGSRIYDPNLGGGVVRDIGIYPLGLIYHTLGSFGYWQSTLNRAKTEVSDHALFQGWTGSGASFQGMVSFKAQTNVEACFFGEKGKIKLTSQWLRPTIAILETEDTTLEFKPEVPGFGFQFEANEVEACVRNNKVESSTWSWENSIQMADYLDRLESGLIVLPDGSFVIS